MTLRALTTPSLAPSSASAPPIVVLAAPAMI